MARSASRTTPSFRLGLLNTSLSLIFFSIPRPDLRFVQDRRGGGGLEFAVNVGMERALENEMNSKEFVFFITPVIQSGSTAKAV